MKNHKITKHSQDKMVEVVTGKIQWTSPLPPPNVLQQYSNISPETLNTLCRVLEERNRHNNLQEERAQELSFQSKLAEECTARMQYCFMLFGKLVGALVAFGGFALCAFALYFGYAKIAFILGGGELTILVALFVKKN